MRFSSFRRLSKKCTSAEEGGASPLFQPCAHTCAKSRIRGTRERSRMYAPPPPLEETFWFRVIRLTWPSKGRKKRVNVDESKKKKNSLFDFVAAAKHTHTRFFLFFSSKKLNLTRVLLSLPGKWALQTKNMKRLEQQLRSLLGSSRGGGAPAAGAATAAEGASATAAATCDADESESSRFASSSARPLAATRFVCSPFSFFSCLLWRAYVSLFLSHVHFSQSWCALLRERGEGGFDRCFVFLSRRRRALSSFFRLFVSLVHQHHKRSLSLQTSLPRFLCWRRGWKSFSSLLQRE